MPQLNILFLFCFLCVGWLMSRRLSAYPGLVRLIIISIAGVLFFRPLIGEGFFLYPLIIFINIILISAFLLLIVKLTNPETRIVFASIDKIFLLFIFILLISLSRSINLLAAINQAIYFLSVYALYWSIKNLPDDPIVKRLLVKTLVVSGLLLIIYAIHQYTIGFTQMREFLNNNPEYVIKSGEFAKRVKQNLVFATFIYPPAFGDYLSMLFLTLFGISYICSINFTPMRAGTLRKYIPVFLILCIVPILILTKSKGAWVSLFSGLTFFTIMNTNKNGSALKPLYAAVLFIVSFISIRLLSKIVLPGFKNFIISWEIRLEYWKTAIMMIKEHPLLGFGPGTFGIVYPAFKTKLAEETIMAHNSFLQIWAESGFFAVCCFVFFICLLFIKAYKNRSQLNPIEIGILAAFFSFLVQNLFDFGLFDAQRATIAFGLLGLYSLYRSKDLSCVVITSKGMKTGIAIICGLLLMSIMIYSTNLYLGRRFNSKAGAVFKIGRMFEAADLSQKAVKHNPISAEYFYHLAYIWENIARQSDSDSKQRMDSAHKAILNYSQAIKLNPFTAYYHLRLAKLIFITKQSGYEQSTLFHLKEAVRMYPLNPVYHEHLAEYYGIIGNLSLKEFELKQAKELKKYFKKGTR